MAIPRDARVVIAAVTELIHFVGDFPRCFDWPVCRVNCAARGLLACRHLYQGQGGLLAYME